MSTRAWLDGMLDYPGLFVLYADSGDVAVKVVLTASQVDVLRASITGAVADEAARRRRRGRR